MTRSLVVVLAALLVSARAAAAPCAHCAYEPPNRDGPAPLLVVLHGDREPEARTLTPWLAAAREHQIALVAPRCPAELGCKTQSFWEWNGDPRWLDDIVEQVASKTQVDPRRVWLAGWSGGASYIGLRFHDLPSRFAAIAVVGGGMVPAQRDCVDAPAPVVMLEGDRNPLHALAVDLRVALERCKVDVDWRLVPRADHGGERRALEKRAGELLAFFEAHAAKPAVAAPSAAPTSAPAASSAPPAAEPPRAAPPAAPRATPPACGCEAAGADASRDELAVVALALAFALRRARRANA